MKVPKTFIPEKNLDGKTQKLLYRNTKNLSLPIQDVINMATHIAFSFGEESFMSSGSSNGGLEYEIHQYKFEDEEYDIRVTYCLDIHPNNQRFHNLEVFFGDRLVLKSGHDFNKPYKMSTSIYNYENWETLLKQIEEKYAKLREKYEEIDFFNVKPYKK